MPKASTIGRLRITLERVGHLDVVFTQINDQLSQSNGILQERRFAIVDARLVEAAQSGLRKPDPEAGWHVRGNTNGKRQAKWGYQEFVNCDEDGFIFATALTPDNKHEINSLTGLNDGSDPALYADRTYSSQNFDGGWQNGASMTRFSAKVIET
ncbi:MAG: transposase [Halopseudomonas aestusnigri]